LLEYGILTAIFPITHITDLLEETKPKQNKRKQDEVCINAENISEYNYIRDH